MSNKTNLELTMSDKICSKCKWLKKEKTSILKEKWNICNCPKIRLTLINNLFIKYPDRFGCIYFRIEDEKIIYEKKRQDAY